MLLLVRDGVVTVGSVAALSRVGIVGTVFSSTSSNQWDRIQFEGLTIETNGFSQIITFCDLLPVTF